MQHLKTIKVRNNKVTLIQIPVRIAENWNLQINDSVEVYEDEQTLIIRPRKGHIEVHPRSGFNEVSQRLVVNSNVS